MSKSKLCGAALLAFGAVLAGGAGPVQAHSVQWRVTLGAPGVVPLPPAVVMRTAPVAARPAYGVRRYGPVTRWDRDGDRIPDRHDRLYNPRWDVDGDGVPNWRDRRDARWRFGR